MCEGKKIESLESGFNTSFLLLLLLLRRGGRPYSTDASASPDRIDFVFDLAYFELRATPFGDLPAPVRIPYPVPFRLLGDEAKGWLDTTYLGENVRISRGNKGTTFVLVREEEPTDGSTPGGTPLPYDFF